MKFTAEQIAGIIDGDIVGDKDVAVSGLAKIEEGKEGTLSFLANMKYEEHIYNTGASIAIVGKEFTPIKDLPNTLTLIKVEDAYACFAQLLEVYNQMKTKSAKIEDPSFIDENATVGNEVYVGAFAYIGEGATIGDNAKIYPNVYIGDNVKVGANTTIHPGAAIYADCEVGENCLIHSGARVGSDGFGFAPDENGEFQKVPQIGNVVLEDFVELGANSTIDRATLGSTIIRRGVKLDNLVHIAHNVEVGRNSAMAAQVGIAGSTKIGENVMLGGQVGVIGHLKIHDNVKVMAQTGVVSSTKNEGDILMGTPSLPANDYKKSFVVFRKLPDILKRLRAVEQILSNK